MRRACVYFEDPLLLAAIPASMFAGIMIFFRMLPETMYHQSRVHPIIPMRTMSLLRTTYITLVYCSLAWISLYYPFSLMSAANAAAPAPSAQLWVAL